ncbi:hypothetical protein [Agromyces italicus]|uniref:hypothetical protein n=1 Tax=Agromyces italicus TaxID=279572 RepID=UPI0003B7B717|nr:hypothetical protein [Agromyces italicus]
MSSSAARDVGRSRIGGARRALLALLGVAAVLVGLLAMHTAGPGTEHGTAATASHVAPESGSGHEALSTATTSTAEHPAIASLIASVGGAVACDEECMSALGDCALMVMGCAMLLMLAAFALVARGPAVFRRLLDRGAAHFTAFLRVIPLHLHRPDLSVLSISRT